MLRLRPVGAERLQHLSPSDARRHRHTAENLCALPSVAPALNFTMLARLALLLAAAPSAAIILEGPTVTSDTYIRGGSSYGGRNLNNLAYGWWDGPMSSTSSSTSAILIKFDLTSLPANTAVLGATLHYYVSNYGNTASLRELTTTWDPATVTYNNLPWSHTSGPWGSTPVAAISGSTGWRSVDVSSSVTSWLSGTTPNNGWIILPTGGNNGGQIQFSTSSRPMRLDINLQTPPVVPPSPTPPAPPAPPPTREFNFNGEASGGITGGCQSTYIRQHLPDANMGATTGHWWDGNSATGYVDAAMVQFTDIIGEGANQIKSHDLVRASRPLVFFFSPLLTCIVRVCAGPPRHPPLQCRHELLDKRARRAGEPARDHAAVVFGDGHLEQLHGQRRPQHQRVQRGDGLDRLREPGRLARGRRHRERQ